MGVVRDPHRRCIYLNCNFINTKLLLIILIDIISITYNRLLFINRSMPICYSPISDAIITGVLSANCVQIPYPFYMIYKYMYM